LDEERRMTLKSIEIYEVHLSVGASMATFYFEAPPTPAHMLAAIHASDRYHDNPDMFKNTIQRISRHDYTAIPKTLVLNR
jgi:hypothetical protein